MKKRTLLSTVLASVLALMGCKDRTMKAEEFTEDYTDPQAIALVTAVVEGDEARVRTLAKAGSDLNAVGRYHQTPLRIAIKVNSKKMLKLLLELGADPNFRTPGGGAVAADWAAAHKDPDYLQILLDHGLDPNLKHDKQPIIFSTIENNNWIQYDMLVAHGADTLTARAADNSTVAWYMASQFEYARLKELILQGADVRTPSNTGLTVVETLANDQARFSGNPQHPAYIARVELLEMLRDKGLEIPLDIPGVRY